MEMLTRAPAATGEGSPGVNEAAAFT